MPSIMKKRHARKYTLYGKRNDILTIIWKYGRISPVKTSKISQRENISLFIYININIYRYIPKWKCQKQ